MPGSPDNRRLGTKPGKFINETNADLANNTNYEVSTPAGPGFFQLLAASSGVTRGSCGFSLAR